MFIRKLKSITSCCYLFSPSKQKSHSSLCSSQNSISSFLQYQFQIKTETPHSFLSPTKIITTPPSPTPPQSQTSYPLFQNFYNIVTINHGNAMTRLHHNTYWLNRPKLQQKSFCVVVL